MELGLDPRSTKQKLSDEERTRLIAQSAARTKEGEGKSVRLDLRIYFNSDDTYAFKAPGVGEGLMARNEERLMSQLAEVFAPAAGRAVLVAA